MARKTTIKILLLFFVCYGVCVDAKGTRLGSNRCTWGQDYWCKDIKNAVECDAVQHCQENVWRNSQNLSVNIVQNMDPCTLCELAIKRAKMIMDEVTVQKQFLAFLKDVCDNAGLGPLAEECKEMVSEYAPIIIKNLDKLLENPKKVCTMMGICKAKDEKVILASLIKHATPRIHFKSLASDALTKSQKCVMCKFIMADLDKVDIPNRIKAVEGSTKKVCNGKAPSYKKQCEQALSKLGSAIISLMRTNVNQICMNYNDGLCKVTSGVLHQATDVTTPNNAKVQQDISCDICIYFMTQAEDMLKNTSMTEEQFEKMMMKLCDQFMLMAHQCKAMVSQYLPLLYELLTELKPYQICQEIMMCPAAKLRKDLRCFLGASFWCANLKNAEQCNALQYCKMFVWKNL